MANRGVKKRKTKYSNHIRLKNKTRRLNKHLNKHPEDTIAKRALSTIS
jgi:ribosomal protein S15P/S13E